LQQLQQLDSETYRPCDASEEDAKNVGGEVMTWVGLLLMPVSCYHPMSRFRIDLFLGDGLLGDHTPLFYLDQLIYSASYPATSDKQHYVGTVRPTLSNLSSGTSTNLFFTLNDIYNNRPFLMDPSVLVQL
jgi:hypothetical protein